jgi:hypothetical protein
VRSGANRPDLITGAITTPGAFTGGKTDMYDLLYIQNRVQRPPVGRRARGKRGRLPLFQHGVRAHELAFLHAVGAGNARS